MNWFTKTFVLKTVDDLSRFWDTYDGLVLAFSPNVSVSNCKLTSISVGDTVELKFGMDSSFVLEKVEI